MHQPVTVTRIRTNAANPGQFFACCGLLELADRLWPGTEARFENGWFYVNTLSARSGDDDALVRLMSAIAHAHLRAIDPHDQTASPIHIDAPFNLTLDWWTDTRCVGTRLKVWAGSMNNLRIARAMQQAIATLVTVDEDLLDQGQVVYEVDKPTKKVEPFYFDARRGSNSAAIDIGFAPDTFHLTTRAYPAVEFLCLVGLQRVRPAPHTVVRTFDYYTWRVPLAPLTAAAAGCGQLDSVLDQHYRFAVNFRTDQRKHKAFMPATRVRR
jgi:CRISPR-associated protein Csx14